MDQSNSTVTMPNISSLPELHPSKDSIRLASAVMLSLFFSVGVPGNIAVIILKPNWEHLSGLSQSLMLNLAVSDLLGLLTLPLWIDILLYGWKFSSVSCKLLAYGVYCSTYGSQLTVTLLSVQRYLLVVHQHKFTQVPKRLLLVLLWLVACIMCIPYFLVQELVSKQEWTDCRPRYSSDAQCAAVLVTETTAGMISVFIVVFSYIHVCRKVKQSSFFNNPQTTRLITSIIEPIQLNQRVPDTATTTELP
ncbi:C-C chemokine receptor type 8-like [Nematolebias whitei]|uniref:C-C chemokine receptor type 8-like n=1 Tax=Nematolebias whitei TaxID=451745 RepID=UPI00189BAFC2|nr:C-C chemokine receptor type 8-like [Nematolebias whitei]